tara:strand:+ start:1315 stop:1629 length:315 start_codon:yes stop_codon:yes gene_type:complete
MSETLEELKAIVDNAPDGATIVDIEVDGFIDYLYVDKCADHGKQIKSFHNGDDSAIEYSNGNIRSLSDIKRIIELMEHIKGLKANTVNFNGGVKCSNIPNNLAM